MRRIHKQAEPKSRSRFKAKANEDWQPEWDNLKTEVKRELHASLMTEQGFICCYCEMRIGTASSHVEHIHPRSRDPVEKQLDYDNLLASCGRESTERQDRSQPVIPRHCGVGEDYWYDQTKFVSPLDDDCEECFRYTADGQIGPSTTRPAAAKETITRLALDIDKLRAMRRGAIEALLEPPPEPDEIPRLLAEFAKRNSSGQFEPFLSAILHTLQSLGPA